MERNIPTPEELDQIQVEAQELNHDTFYTKLETETDSEKRRDLEQTIQIAEAVKEAGGKALVVGGYARDEAYARMNDAKVDGKDIDIEIYSLDFAVIKKILEPIGKLNEVGESFAVAKVGNLDVAIPRRDSKVNPEDKKFIIDGDPSMTTLEAARRRDFTINSMALDPLTGQLIDEVGGLDDMKMGILRATDYDHFGEDALRVLRAMQFAGRFNMQVEARTVEICRQIDLSDLPKKRVGNEWDKLLLKSPNPSVGMEVARELGVIEKLHPELNALIDCPQDPEWHPEGDVWTHTKMVVDEAAAIVRREGLTGNDARTLMLAALCHDLGKPATTEEKIKKGRMCITAENHEAEGVEPMKQMLSRWEIDDVSMPDMIRRIGPLVRDHLYPFSNPDALPKALRRLARRLYPASIQELVWVAEADKRGRGTPFGDFSPQIALVERAKEEKVHLEPIKPLVLGRHLLSEGLQEGKHFGPILAQLEQAQEEGEFDTTEGGIEYYRTHIRDNI